LPDPCRERQKGETYSPPRDAAKLLWQVRIAGGPPGPMLAGIANRAIQQGGGAIMTTTVQRYARIAAMLALAAISLGARAAQDGAAAAARMNILVIMTDDQRFDTVDKMPNLAALAKQGVTFSNSYNPTPLCAPSRSMLFSGGYRSQNTGVLENNLPDGGVGLFNDKKNLGTFLQAAGYRTGFVGKWINGYESKGRYIPPGWTRFVGRQSWGVSSNWFAFNYMIGSSGQASALGTRATAQQYTTYYERDQVLGFMSATSTQPFFVIWSPTAPHATATPAHEDEEAFDDYVYGGGGYGETDRSDSQPGKGVAPRKGTATSSCATSCDPC